MPIDSVLWAGAPATDDQIAEVEQEEGVQFPDDYRAFLKRWNGGRPNLQGFRISDQNASLLNVLFGVAREEPHLDLQTQSDKFRKRLQPDLLPVGRDAGGNLVCLSIHGPKTGRVFFWDHNIEPASPSFENVTEIAPSFAAFVEGLFE